MVRTVKVSLIICFFYAWPAMAQSPYATQGKFTFRRALAVPETFEIGPGQLSKDGDAFIVGLIDGDLENLVELHSDLYAYNVSPDAPPAPITAFNLNIPIDSMRAFQVTASKNEEHLVFVVNAYSGWNDNELAIASKQPNGSYGPVQLLSNLNDPLMSDAYPWISGDGMRLYYTRNFKLLYTERTSADAAFSDPVDVRFAGEVQLEIMSVWLSPDERSLFLVANNRIYRSQRKSSADIFSLPELYTDEFKDLYFISGVSFAPDKKNMYLYYSDEQTQQILHYQLTKGKAW